MVLLLSLQRIKVNITLSLSLSLSLSLAFGIHFVTNRGKIEERGNMPRLVVPCMDLSMHRLSRSLL